MSIYWNGKEYETPQQAALAEFVTVATMRYRLSRGYCCDEQLNRTGEFRWNGKCYKSLSELMRETGQTWGEVWYRYNVKHYRCDCDVRARRQVNCEHKRKQGANS